MHRCQNIERTVHSENFTYRGYQCRIEYTGFDPALTVDGKAVEQIVPGFTVERETLRSGSQSWKYALMKAIDEWEGDNVEADDYVDPESRKHLIDEANEFFDDVVPTVFSTYTDAVGAVESYPGGWYGVYDAIQTEWQERIRDTDVESTGVSECRVFVAKSLLSE